MVNINLVDKSNSDIGYEISRFPDGQQSITIDVSQTKKLLSVEIHSRFCNFKDLELIICTVKALRRSQIENIYLYIPYLLGARSERLFDYGQPSYLVDVVAPIINGLELKGVSVLDVHSPPVTDACIKNLITTSNKLFVEFAFKHINSKALTLISPDEGASKKIYKLASKINFEGDIIICSKERNDKGEITKTVVPLSSTSAETDFVIIDDICDGGQTFINISKEIKKQLIESGTQSKIYLMVTHGIFSKGLEHVMEHFDGIFCTNSYSDTTYIPNISADEVGAANKIFKQLNIF